MDYKIGDKVKIIQGSLQYNGKTGTVVAITEDDRILIKGTHVGGAIVTDKHGKRVPSTNTRYVTESMIVKVN